MEKLYIYNFFINAPSHSLYIISPLMLPLPPSIEGSINGEIMGGGALMEKLYIYNFH
jgi:hypothetical protein